MAADSEFVFDAVIGFLTSPIWNAPVLTFIEQKCLVFDPDGEEHETYKEIHEEYKHMVETLLSSFLKDMGITAEQFTNACKARDGSAQLNDIHKNIFEQVWAAEDFEVFKRLMIQKNIELQLQALKLIQQRSQQKSQGNKTEQSPEPASVPVQTEALDEEDAIMQEVLRLSKEEYEQKTKEEKKEEEELERTLAQASDEHESKNLTKALEEAENAFELRLKSIAEREQVEMEKALRSCIISQQEPKKESNAPKEVEPSTSSRKKEKDKSSTTAPSSTPVLAPQKKPEVSKPPASKQALPPVATSKKSTSPADAAASWMSSAKAESSTASSSTSSQATEMTESELKRRTEYLKQQRDRLLQMKKQEREKKLHKYTEEQPKARPTSARAARQVTAGERVSSPSSTSPTDEKKLAMRRALADVLKREVIEKQ